MKPFSLVGISKHFIAKTCLCLQGRRIYYYSSSMKISFVRNGGTFLPHDTAPHLSEFQTPQKMHCFTYPCLLLSKFGTTIVTLSWCRNDFKTYKWTHWIMQEIKSLPAAMFCTPDITNMTTNCEAPTVKLFPSNNLHFG